MRQHDPGQQNEEGAVDLYKLKAFHAVVTEGTFRAAAATLGRSPSSLSAYINQLETDIGTPLLIRTTRSVTLT
ncbi:MAG: LysR family transcriptional regulator, partial [Actinomycetota bacterium]|nr:LysR family transcriptional regulator [Actinomycetota bacterium]